MRIILVTHESAYGRYLAAKLHEAGAIDHVIVETGRPSWRFYARKLRRVGPVNFGFQWWLNRWFQREGARHLPEVAFPPHERVPNVNAYRFGPDDLIIGFGTSYITPTTLRSLRQGFLNLHTGLLPWYRGVKSEFWVLYHSDVDRAGWTLHYMTEKLDQGDIVAQGMVRADTRNPAELRARLLEHAIPALVALAGAVRERGAAAVPRRPQEDGRYFTTPTWREWRAFKRMTA
jgi:hypothetical protein